MKKLGMVILLIAVLLIGIVIGAEIREIIIPTTGEVSKVNVSVTWLSDGSEVTSLDWGTTDNSTPYEMEPFNITNTSNVPITLELSTANLSPSIISLSLTWNYTATTLAVDEWRIIALTQNCTAMESYTYDTIIRGVET